MTADRLDPRAPVLIGVGEAHRPADGAAGIEPLELMVEAAVAAFDDAGVASLRSEVGMIAVPEGTWSYPDVARLIADRLGATGARTVRADVGVPQTEPLAVAFERIRRGELDTALIVGGEAMASATVARRAGAEVAETSQGDAVADERWSAEGEIIAEVRAGMWSPVEQYACIENALGHAEGQTFDEQLDDIAELWAGFNAVATTNPRAAFARPRSAAELRVAGPDNRPIRPRRCSCAPSTLLAVRGCRWTDGCSRTRASGRATWCRCRDGPRSTDGRRCAWSATRSRPTSVGR